jgi:hypothetical protein
MIIESHQRVYTNNLKTHHNLYTIHFSCLLNPSVEARRAKPLCTHRPYPPLYLGGRLLLLDLMYGLDRSFTGLCKIRDRRSSVVHRCHVLFFLDDLGVGPEVPGRPEVDVGRHSQEERQLAGFGRYISPYAVGKRSGSEAGSD